MKHKYPIEIPIDKIKIFCKRWKVKEFALFGSVIREDFNLEKSDVDVLITFFPDQILGWDVVDMKDELETIFNRKVDMVNKEVIQKSLNPYRKKSILEHYEVVYEQAA